MDLRSERAVALLSEFLDSEDVWIPDPPGSDRGRDEGAVIEDDAHDTPFKRAKRHKHAEHFVHGESNSSGSDRLSRFADL